METSTISLEHTGRFNRLILDYVNGEAKLKEFYGFAHTKANYAKQIETRRQFPVGRALLADSLLKQYRTIGGAKDSVLSNIGLLREDNTFTVTTGHQLNIFTGPLYFIYKILHTIKLSEQLREAHPENNFVPIYWMNTEDHDLAEVGQLNLFGKKYEWETGQTGATGRMGPNSLTALCDQLDKVFDNDGRMRTVVALFRKAYGEFDDLAKATRFFTDQLFGHFGLVIIDGDDAALKRSFVEYFKKDIIENRPFRSVREADRKLEAAGYHNQVTPRQINTFYLTDGGRHRIVESENGFKVFQTDIRFTQDEIISELEAHPERFSPNVVLRPLFQEFILPNLTYVGGAGELAYWLQYKEYFNEMKVSFPMLSLRNHFMLIDGDASKRMDELKLLPEDLFHSVDELVKAHVLELSDTEVELTDELALVQQAFAKLKEKAEAIDPSLFASIEAEQTKVEKGLDQWKGRFTRSLKKNNEVSVNRIQKVHRKLFPNGLLQERHDNFMEFQAKTEFLNTVYEATDPFSTDFRVVFLDRKK